MAVSIPQHSGYTVQNGEGTGSNGNRIYVWVEYKVVSQSIANNTSVIDAYFYSALNPSYSSNTYGGNGLYSSFSVGGVSGNVVSNGAYDYRNANNIVYMGSFNGTVAHNSDGSKSLTIEGSFSTKSSYITGGKISFTVALPTIARASTPTLSASSAKMGSVLTIYTNRLSSGFTHTLYYTTGNTKVTMATGVGTSYAWTIPDLAANFNNALSGTCVITCDTYNGSTKVGSKTVSLTLTVPDATAPTFSVTSVNVGNSVTINTARKSSNFKHTLSYSFGGATGTIASNVTTSSAWNIPYSLAAKIPSATSGTCTITCQTYNGTALVGTKTATFTITIPNNETTRPSISSAIIPTHTLPDDFNGLYLQGKTRIAATIEASSEYSTIKEYRITVNGQTKSSSEGTVVSDVIGTYGDTTVRCEVVDARGYSNSEEHTINVVAYSRPAIVPVYGENKVVCERCTPDGTPSSSGTRLLVKVERKYSPVLVDGVQKNFCEIRYRSKLSLSESFSGWNTLVDSSVLNIDLFEGPVPGAEFDSKYSFVVEVGVIDAVGGEADATAILFDIPTDSVTFHLGKNGNKASFGKYAEHEDAVEIVEDWDLYVYGMTLKEYIKAVINGTQ